MSKYYDEKDNVKKGKVKKEKDTEKVKKKKKIKDIEEVLDNDIPYTDFDTNSLDDALNINEDNLDDPNVTESYFDESNLDDTNDNSSEVDILSELPEEDNDESFEDVDGDLMKNSKKKKKDKTKSKKVKGKKIKIKAKKEKRKWWKKLISFFLVCGALGVFLVFAFCIYIVYSCDEFDPNALANQDQTLIYDSNGKVIAKLGIEKRESITYDDLPQVLVDAIVATEDSRYFEHNGVDGARFLKASVGQLLGNSWAGGASTLTMQVVKNNLTSTEKTITRKFKDIYLAVFFMEEKYTKEEILEFYVNDSYLGGSVYGVEEASKYYFNKSVSELSLPEASLIAGLFQAPSSYNPYNYPEAAATRRNTVLKLMVRHGYITQEEADIANSVDVSSMLANNNQKTSYQGFIDTVVEEVQNKTGFDPALVSMEIYTTLDVGIQDGINKILAGDGYNWKDDNVQAGVTIVDVNTGAIVAIGTGRNRTGERVLNYATQVYRQPGSTAKPIFAYAPGFEFDNFSTYQLFVDEEWSYSDGTRIGNWDNKYDGIMTLRRALSVSRNIPALKAFQTVQKDVGNKKIVEFVEGLGIDLENDVAYEAYSIGGLSSGVSTLQMAAAYAAFANGGYYTDPYTVKSITYRDSGETVEFEVKKTQAMKDSTAYLITNVLEYASKYGFDGGTKYYKGNVAVKTGTSNFDDATLRAKGLPSTAVNDLWTVAYTPQYSIALWYGYDVATKDNYSKSSDGTAYKDPLMRAIMNYIPVNTSGFKVPGSVVKAQVEDGTWPAMKPSEYTPADLIKTEYFISGTEPTDVSPRFSKLNPVKDVTATSDNKEKSVKVSWNYTPNEVTTREYLTKYFSQPVFGNSANKFLDERLNFNENTLGGIGFGIYSKGSNGELKLLEFTKETHYNYTGNSDATLVIKAEYANEKNTSSDGVEVKVTGVKRPIKDNDDDDDTTLDNSSTKLLVTLDGGNSINATLGKYTEKGIDSIIYGGANGIRITHELADITYYIGTSKYTSISDLENAVNAIDNAKTINIKYEVKYKGEVTTVTRKVSLTD